MIQQFLLVYLNFSFFLSVPAFQFLGGMPLSVMKASLSRLVEPQEQGKMEQNIFLTCHIFFLKMQKKIIFIALTYNHNFNIIILFTSYNLYYFNQSNVAHVTPYHIYFEFLQCYIYKLISWYIYYLLTQLLISLPFNITNHFNFYEYIISTLF